MKKIFFVLLITLFAIKSYAQAGDLTVGAKGAYMSKYEGFMYGLDVSYQLSPLLEVNLSGLMNTNIHVKDKYFGMAEYERKVAFYSGNLDLRFLLINAEMFSTGPALGGQYAKFKIKQMDNSVVDDGTAWGFNVGWHIRVAVTDNLKLNGGWRYTSASEDQSHHVFYLGAGYSFSLF